MIEPIEHPPSSRQQKQGQTFWPRAGRHAVHHDYFCRKCGYNLRGLTVRRCPECGEEFEPFDGTSGNIPWAQRHFLGFFDAYWQTVRLVFFNTPRLAKEAWGVHEPEVKEASAFRRLTILHAWVPLTILWIAAVKWIVPGSDLLWWSVGGAAAVLVWVIWSSMLMVHFIRKQNIPTDRGSRALALAHYTSAGLGASAIHLIPLVASALVRTTGDPIIFQAILMVWGGLAAWHIVHWLWTCAAFAAGVMNWDSGTTTAFAIILGGYWLLGSAALLTGVPWAAANVISALL